MVLVPTATDLAVELGFLGEEFLAQISERKWDFLRCFAHGGEEVAVYTWIRGWVRRVWGV